MAKSNVAVKHPVEWLSFDQTMRVLMAAKVGSIVSHVLTDWCAAGMVDSMAATIIRDGGVERDVELNPEIWKFVQDRRISFSAMSGTMQSRYRVTETSQASSINIMGLRFRKDQLLDLVSHADKGEVERALAATGGWLDGSKKDGTTAKIAEVSTVSIRGRKPEAERWQAFWFAVVEIANEGRLTTEHFNGAAALSEEILLMMGDSAFSPDHVKRLVGQIYKRFIAA